MLKPAVSTCTVVLLGQWRGRSDQAVFHEIDLATTDALPTSLLIGLKVCDICWSRQRSDEITRIRDRFRSFAGLAVERVNVLIELMGHCHYSELWLSIIVFFKFCYHKLISELCWQLHNIFKRRRNVVRSIFNSDYRYLSVLCRCISHLSHS